MRRFAGTARLSSARGTSKQPITAEDIMPAKVEPLSIQNTTFSIGKGPTQPLSEESTMLTYLGKV